MNIPKTLFKLVLERKGQPIESFKKFHVYPILHRQLPVDYLLSKYIDSSLFLTTLPKEKRPKGPKLKPKKLPTGPLIISCKNEKLNHFHGMFYNQFEEVPLASKGWKHRKSKGDHFTILPVFEHSAFASTKAEELPKTFPELGISEKIINELEKMGIYNPTVIQAKAISKLMMGKNVLINAETGCGKTLAYLIPIMEHILKTKESVPWQANAPFGIILLPTKELAAQVGGVISKFGANLGLHCVTLISGDFENIEKAPSIEITDVIVSTLGILMRYMISNIYSTANCQHLVLDEADVFFEQDFVPDLKRFLKMAKLNCFGLRKSGVSTNSTQVCLTSATSIMKTSGRLDGVFAAEYFETASTSFLHKVLLHVRQHFMRLNKSEKPEALLKIIKSNVKNRIPTIIFSNYTDTCHFLYNFLNDQGLTAAKINANMFSDERLKGFMDFKNERFFVLIGTDCMSRGLDMPWVKHIINYDIPNNIPSYIHRCGRAGRLGYDENCLVTNFVSGKNEVRYVNEIELAARTGRELNLKIRNDTLDERRPVKRKHYRRKMRQNQ